MTGEDDDDAYGPPKATWQEQLQAWLKRYERSKKEVADFKVPRKPFPSFGHAPRNGKKRLDYIAFCSAYWRLEQSLQTLQSDTGISYHRLRLAGESQGDRLRRFAEHLGPLVCGLDTPLRKAAFGAKPLPDVLAHAQAAEVEVREALARQPASRLRAKPESLLAGLAVSVLMSPASVLSKQRAHTAYTGNHKASPELSKLMTPHGRWRLFGTVDGDYLRLSEQGRQDAERLKALGAVPLSARGSVR